MRAPATVLLALGAGVLGAVQPKINAELAARVESSLLASLVNFTAALVAVIVTLALRPGTRAQLRRARSWPVPWWTLTAGLGGAMVVLAGAVTVETIGVAAFSIAFFAGQVTAGLLVDRLGIGAGVARPVTVARVVAAALAIAAVVLSQLDRPTGDLAPLLVVLVVAAGAASAFQAAFNGRVAAAVGDPFAPTAVNVAVGTVALAAVVATSGDVVGATWPSEPWLYLGGFLGVVIVLALAIGAAALGVLRTTLAMLAAQLVTAFVIDWVVLDDAPSLGAIAGAALIVAAVLVVRRSPQADAARAARATASP